MKIRSRILFILLLFALVGAVTWQVLKSREPEYKGKHLGEWLAHAGVAEFRIGPNVTSKDSAAEILEAHNAVQHIGSQAIPTLLRMLEKNDSNLASKLEGLARSHSFIKLHFTNDGFFFLNHHFVRPDFANARAEIGFKILGAVASNAVPDLMRIYEQNISKSSRIFTAISLGHVGPAAKDAIPLLMAAVTNSDSLTSIIGLKALGDIHAAPSAVVPLLITTFANTNNSMPVRMTAASILRQFGSDARLAVPALLEMLDQIGQQSAENKKAGQLPDNFVQRLQEVLQKIDPETAAKVLSLNAANKK